MPTTNYLDQLNPKLLQYGAGTSYSNPMYRYIHSFIPSNLMELFVWCEYIFNNSPQLATSIRRFAEYPITDIMYPEDNKDIDNYKNYYQEIDLKNILICAALDYFVYGNCFISPYYPFVRFLKCPSCSHTYNIEAVEYKLESDFNISMDCPDCKKRVSAEITDVKLRTASKLRWVRWNPKDIQVSHNKISGENKYYLRVPPDTIDALKVGLPQYIKSTPIEIIEAVKNNSLMEFSNDQIFHIAAPAPAGFARGWGHPLLTQALSEILHVAVLKRANEAIAWEHIVPRIIVSPAASGTQADPIKHMNMARWKTEFMKAKDTWSRDPNFVMYAPFPVNVQTMGGDGRALMVTAEIEATEKSVAMALGIPLEFAAGTIAWQSSSMSLRLLKNQMHKVVEKIERLVQWITLKTSNYLQWPYYKFTLAPFDLIDDESRKQVLLQLNAVQKVSDETLLRAFGLDLEDELGKLKNEAINKAKWQREVDQELAKDMSSLQSQAQATDLMAMTQDPSNNVQYVMQQASTLVPRLLNMPGEQRNMLLEQMKQSNFAQYAIVKELYDIAYSNLLAQKEQYEATLAQQGGAIVPNVAMGSGAPTPPPSANLGSSGIK